LHPFQSIAEFIVNNVEAHGVVAVFLLMMVEGLCMPVPAEVTMMIAGLLVARGDASMFVMVTAGVLGNVLGCAVIWWVGAHGGRSVLVQHGRWVGVRESHVELVERWFDRYGITAVIVSRCVPVVRTFASLPAGIAGMRFIPFTLATALGCVPFVAAFAALGYFIGDRWSQIHDDFKYVNGAVIGILAIAISGYIVYRWMRRRSSPA
jgi:membrane protein DedA with SNARE-associated domain